jgi:hypothetical protein
MSLLAKSLSSPLKSNIPPATVTASRAMNKRPDEHSTPEFAARPFPGKPPPLDAKASVTVTKKTARMVQRSRLPLRGVAMSLMFEGFDLVLAPAKPSKRITSRTHRLGGYVQSWS